MSGRPRSVLAVFLATVVVVVGIVVIVATSRGAPTAAPVQTSSPPPNTSRIDEPRPTLTVDSGCRLGDGPATLPEVPPAVSDRAWERIETWLAANAPVSAASLRPPADDESILRAQRETGAPLPAELVASLRRHDGIDQSDTRTFVFPSFMHPLPAPAIADEATMMCEVLAEVGDDGAVGPWWHGQYVPIAVDHGGDSLFLDQRARWATTTTRATQCSPARRASSSCWSRPPTR